MQYSATGGVLMVKVMYTLLRSVQWNGRCIGGSSDVQITAYSIKQEAVYWWFKWCTYYCRQFSATGGVLMVQVMYRILNAVQCNWRCIDGSSAVQITTCSTVHVAVNWWIKSCTYYCMQYSVTGGEWMVQVKYRILHAVQCNWRCVDGSRGVRITACSTVHVAV